MMNFTSQSTGTVIIKCLNLALFDCQIDFCLDIFSLTFPLHYNGGNYMLTSILTQP